ncbi:hypothetical protein FVE85_9720 [Porphyridium purpureum]|uniref:Uncharacterized protein n=1 Tax=Porphyridium purpureum TaxID=35688 RepID=A0A5J4YLY8_PORPP|nr:hypothetical protein FVE85_9720 [Porphyridium purpureum]|eukprot:POR3274..scf246_12
MEVPRLQAASMQCLNVRKSKLAERREILNPPSLDEQLKPLAQLHRPRSRAVSYKFQFPRPTCRASQTRSCEPALFAQISELQNPAYFSL